MTGWRRALLALVAWAIHFFVAYGLMLAFPHSAFVGWLSLGLGCACLALVAWGARPARGPVIVKSASIISSIAIIWQSLVVFFE